MNKKEKEPKKLPPVASTEIDPQGRVRLIKDGLGETRYVKEPHTPLETGK